MIVLRRDTDHHSVYVDVQNFHVSHSIWKKKEKEINKLKIKITLDQSDRYSSSESIEFSKSLSLQFSLFSLLLLNHKFLYWRTAYFSDDSSAPSCGYILTTSWKKVQCIFDSMPSEKFASEYILSIPLFQRKAIGTVKFSTNFRIFV